MKLTNRLLLVLVLAAQALSLAACIAKCLPGYKMEGGSCKKLPSEGAAGMELPVTAAGAGGDSMTLVSTANAPQSGSGASSGAGPGAATGSGQQPGSGGASAAASASANQSTSEPCDAEGSTRCAPSATQGTRETCMGKVWVQSAQCAGTETCVMQEGSAECAAVEKLCVGSNGQPVCDGQGTLLLCNDDGTVRSQEMCNSAKLCRAGMAAGQCALCVADEEYRCTDKALELCGSDGMSFATQTECETAALCNPTLAMCTAAVCMPGTFSCVGNTLKVCNADGTAFDEARSMPCGSGTCDAKGMDCNMCEPGMQMCMDDSVAQCDETGQRFEQTPCAGGMKCVGAGNCVCEPQCQGKRCGSDGCSGNCGTCSGGTKCSTDFQCVECAASQDCSGGEVCDSSSHTCACDRNSKECSGRCINASACCPGTGTGQSCTGGGVSGVCNSSGQCVECVTETDCAARNKHCDTARNACIGCRNAGDCPGGQLARCDNGTCSMTECVPGVEVSPLCVPGTYKKRTCDASGRIVEAVSKDCGAECVPGQGGCEIVSGGASQMCWGNCTFTGRGAEDNLGKYTCNSEGKPQPTGYCLPMSCSDGMTWISPKCTSTSTGASCSTTGTCP